MWGALEANSERPRRMQNQRLLFQAGTREALDDLALEEEERDQRGQAAEHRRRHDLGVMNTVGGLHRRQADRQRHHLRAGDGDERPDEVVPGGNEGEDGDRRNRGPREGHPDLPVDAPAAGPVHDGGILQFARQAVEELLEDEDRNRYSDLRQDDAPVRVDHTEGLDYGEQWDDQDWGRHHDARQDEPEGRISAAEW